jgi:CubicO group peptidase (beta-lactamase class C family)
MKKLLLAGVLCAAVVSLTAQTSVTGRWRAILLLPTGQQAEIGLDLKSDGSSVSGTVTGPPVTIRDGRIEGETITLNLTNANGQPTTFTGQLSRDEIVFTATGLGPQPLRFIAVRDLRGTGPSGSITDAAFMTSLLKQTNVPGVSIAIIQDFKVALAVAYGVADVETGAPVTPTTMFQAASISKPVAAMMSLRAVQDGRFALDQNVNTILKSWKLPEGEFTKNGPVTPRSLMSHVSGTGDGFGFPGYAPGAKLPTLPQILDGVQPPSNLRAVRLERAPYAGFEYSGGGVMIQQLALTDAVGKPFAQIAREWVLDPLAMTNSTFEQPLPAARHAQAARAHNGKGVRSGADPWHAYPEQAAAGLWTTPTDLAKFAIEVQLATAGRSKKVLSPVIAREMITPVGVGTYAVGFSIVKQGEGWYFGHGGSNWGFQCAVIMTNGDAGGALINQIRQLIQREYKWDTLDQPIPRRYGPV